MSQVNATAAGRGQLAWHCRRGMKELDLLLLGYLDECWAGAAADERTAFEAFLRLPDPVIAGYLLGGEEAPDVATQDIVATMRALRAGQAGPAGRRPT